MSMFPTKILLATDGSDEATLAARTAADLANRTESELHLVHSRAVPMRIDAGWEATRDAPYAEEPARREAQEVFDAQVEQIKAVGGKVVQTHTRLGYPMKQIIILAEEIRAGLIVMGSRGLGGIKRALMGSVSDSLVHHAHCPVLVVRAGENGQEVTLSSKRILLATDGSEEATVAGQAATEVAQKTDSELHLVHISHPLYDPSYFEEIYTGDDLKDEEAEIQREEQKLLKKQVKSVEAAGGSVAQAHSRAGRPNSEITDLAEEIGASLVVVGSRGLGTMSRVLMGSVSDSVVHHAHCSVMVVRKEKG